jgi:dTDP-glucose pyrophosphorylase
MFNNFIINPKKSLKSALKLISKNGCKTVLVVEHGKYLGTLSDGDIRKAILKKNNLNIKISNFYNNNSIFLKKENYTELNAKKLFLKNNLDIIPVVNKKKKLIKILTWKNFFKSEKKINKNNIPIVIMAGGIGKRLLPITSILPKPLVPIKGKPVIDYIIESFQKGGFYKFKFIINYYSKIVEAYLKGGKLGKNFLFFTETKPLGTIGGIRKLKFHEDNLLVSNCDVIFKIDYKDLIKFHIKGKKDLTIVSSHKNYKIPYGVCNLDENGNLSHIDEKPNFDFLINSGLYLLKKNIISLIPPNQKFDFTDLINICIKNKKEIGIYPISEDQWIDMGQWSEYQKALESL